MGRSDGRPDVTAGQAAESKDSPTLESKVAAKLAELRDQIPAQPEAQESPTSNPKQESQLQTPESKEAAESEKVREPEQKSEPESKTDSNLPTLPTGYRRAALARGWTDEEIDFALENDKDSMDRFERNYREWQEENARWSQRGRMLLQAEQKPAEKPVEPSVSDAEIDKLIAQLDDGQAPIKEIVNWVKASLNKANTQMERVAEFQSKVQASDEEKLLAEAQEFLKSKEMEPFQQVYGTDIKNLTADQFENLKELLNEADIIRCGAFDHGKTLPTHEALRRAHAYVSRDLAETTWRDKIRETMKKRTKTLPPASSQRLPSDSDKPISEKELERRTAERLAKIRGK